MVSTAKTSKTRQKSKNFVSDVTLARVLHENPNVETEMQTAVLIAERQSDWGRSLEILRESAEDVTIVVQGSAESASQFATRVRRRVEEVSSGRELVAASLVGGDEFESDTLSSRSTMVRAVVAQMASGRGGQMHLDGGSQRGRGKHAMQALATVVAEQIRTTGVVLTTPEPARRAA